MPVESDLLDAGSRSRQTRLPDGVYPTGAVTRLLGVTRRQLQYWAQTDLVRPSARTPGGHARYTFGDLVALKATKQLIDAGVSVQRIRSSICSLRRILPTIERPLSDLVLVATGDVVLVLREGAAFEAISGQEWIFEVSQLQRQVEAASGRSRGARHGPRRAAREPDVGERTA
ncbi:MAG: MerR family transcriptional regulator [Myxococcota bacterium]|nr:MerR family transcriptional regulator [Myxococcota bacterium]